MTTAVPQAATTRRKTTERAKSQSKALVTKLTDAGEDALQRLAELPGGQRAFGAFNELRNRVDELSKKVRGIDELERRIKKLEKQVAELKPPRKATTRSTPKRPPTTPT
ncbi:MAG: hypothetical protein E6G11_02000 [Actinobacteria bacterium]|nr:MAG: hypothetical protein E6G11_02000 [Actinomycetota bacterium]